MQVVSMQLRMIVSVMVKQKHTENLNLHRIAPFFQTTSWMRSAALVLLACASLVSISRTEIVHAQTASDHQTAVSQQDKKLPLVKLSNSKNPAFSKSLLTLTQLTYGAEKNDDQIKRLVMPKPAPAAPAAKASVNTDQSSNTVTNKTTTSTVATTTAQTSSAYSSAGLNMNQTTGFVNITALANYMASLHTVSGFSAAEWAKVITGESGGQVDVWNQSGTPCYGVFQEWGVAQGTTLGQQIQIAADKPASAWAATV